MNSRGGTNPGGRVELITVRSSKPHVHFVSSIFDSMRTSVTGHRFPACGVGKVLRVCASFPKNVMLDAPPPRRDDKTKCGNKVVIG